MDESALVAEAASAGVGLQGVAAGFAGEPPRGGIIFGYGAVDERRIDAGLRQLAALDAWRSVAPAA
jgi:DNA-binding transcriptional MocR family regulator